jgi:hypothetical protein
MDRHARATAALLGVILASAWMVGWETGASAWLVWTDLFVACVALGGLGPAATEELSGIATWPFAGLLLFGAWWFGLRFGATSWLNWLNLGVSCAFLLLTVGYTLASNAIIHLHFHHALHHRRLGHT